MSACAHGELKSSPCSEAPTLVWLWGYGTPLFSTFAAPRCHEGFHQLLNRPPCLRENRSHIQRVFPHRNPNWVGLGMGRREGGGGVGWLVVAAWWSLHSSPMNPCEEVVGEQDSNYVLVAVVWLRRSASHAA